MKERPVIGIAMRLELETDRFYLGRDYSEALQGLGAVPFHIGLIPDPGYVADIFGLVDGILLPGSDSDIDPLAFGDEPAPGLGRVVPEKDRNDALLLAEAERRGTPLFGICYGMQALNVSRGGTLIQDIGSQVPGSIQHQQGRPLARNSHSVTVAADSRLARLTGNGCTTVNSHHHQAVRELGANLRATAWAKDDVVECIEDTRDKRFVLGVQWHPELSWKWDACSRALFECFINACRKGRN